MAASDASLSIAADSYKRYPAEAVQFFVRPSGERFPAGHTIWVGLPEVFKVEDFHLTSPGQQASLAERPDGAELRWLSADPANPPSGELVIHARLDADAPQGAHLAVAACLDPSGEPVFQTGAQITVDRFASSLQYLPEIYTRDDFANRLLMLFESFWKPISQQIDNVSNYFDPLLTPTEFIPWLGTWFGLLLEEDLPESTRRQILSQIAPIFAHKGTRQSLEAFLRLYTGSDVTVYEHRDDNFTLGAQSRLGYQVALGTHNRPHSFDVTIQAPRPNGDPREAAVSPEQYRRRIQALIEMFKPAHTVYHLDIRTETA